MILLTCAVEKELGFWVPRPGIETLITGVGPVEASCAVAHALAQERFRLVVAAGIAGAFDGAAEIGDGVIVADETIELDLETGSPIQLPEGKNVVNKAHSDLMLVNALRNHGFAVVHGITVSRVTSTQETADRLAAGGAQIESMEGFAVLRAAERAGIPAIELRGISNRVGSRESSGWDFDAGIAGLKRVATALFELLDGSDGHSG